MDEDDNIEIDSDSDPNSELPSREVPEGLSPSEYYKLGIDYKSMGWTEQARDAMMLAIENGDAEVVLAARRFLKTKIPRHPVPLFAEQKNIEAFNLMAEGDESGARRTYEELIRDFPDFEWPYGNLSVLYVKEGKLNHAKKLLQAALEINPDYIGGWLHMAHIKSGERDLPGARRCIERALQSDPTDAAALAHLEVLNKIDDIDSGE